MAIMTVNNIITQCNELKEFWSVRKKQFEDWYDLLLLTNKLAQTDMESVIANDPATGFRMALHLLTASIVNHKIPTEGLERPEIVDTSDLELYFTNHWQRIERDHRRLGRQSWLREFVSFMLATGWYSIFVHATPKELIAEVWNPAEVFSEFSNDGQERCAHIYELTPRAANRKARINGWALPRPFNANTTVYNYFIIDNDGDAANAIVMGNILVRPMSKLDRTEQASSVIPVFTSPVAGLPDMGSIKSGKDWQKNYGESLLAPNADEFNNQNRMLSYVQQLVRDSANPRWFEQSRGDKGILAPETIFKRGAIYRGSPEDNITPLPTVPIPVEIRTILFDYGNRIQRGLFPWALYGNIQQQLSGYMMSQIASVSIGALAPYAEAMTAVLADIDNYWFKEIRERGLTPYKFKMPENIPPDVEFEVTYNINIPGSLIQRMTAARMMNPSFRVGYATTCDLMFPEIKDPLREQGLVNKDEALMNPIAQALALIDSYREIAKIATDAGDTTTAALYTKAADAVESQLSAAPTKPAGPPAAPGEVRGAAPREEMGPPMPPGGEVT